MSNNLTAVINGTMHAAAAAILRDDPMPSRLAYCWQQATIVAHLYSPTGPLDRTFLAEVALLAAAVQADAVTWAGKEWVAAETLVAGGFNDVEGQVYRSECGRNDDGSRWVGDPIREPSFVWLTGHLVLTQSTLTEVLARTYLESKGYTTA